MAKKRILLIDDESGFTRLLKLALPAFEICEENDATTALATARTFKPDLIFLDVIMPNLDGGALASEIRATPELSRVPIVFLTAILSDEEAEAKGSIGGYPFLAKPISREKIISCIEKHLGV